jgi:hypothetical protein
METCGRVYRQWRLVAKISGGAAPDFCIFFINWGMATDIKLKDYILYKYKERIKEKKDSLYYMLSIISSGNRGCCSSTVPIREPPLCSFFLDLSTRLR